MELSRITAIAIGGMMVVTLIGYLAARSGVIDKKANKALSNLLLKVVSPIMIFTSYQQEYNSQNLIRLLEAMALAMVGHILSIIVAKIMLAKRVDANASTDTMATVYSNCGYVGIPILFAMFGNEGVFYATAYISAFNIFFWTHGLMTMSGEINLSGLKKALRTPNMIAIYTGLLFYVFRLRLPQIILTPFQQIQQMTAPLAMLIIGASLYGQNIIAEMKQKSFVISLFSRLILVPVIFMFIIKFIPIYDIAKISMLVGMAAPVGANIAALALQYDKDVSYASALIGVSTILCSITLPIIIYINSII